MRNEHRATMYRQSSGWITSIWDEQVQMYRTSHEMNYWQARARIGAENCRHGYGCGIESHNHQPVEAR